MLTLRGASGADVLPKTLAALDWLDAHGAEPTISGGQKKGARPPADPSAPTCPSHGSPMRQGKRGYFCPRKNADGGYCRQTA